MSDTNQITKRYKTKRSKNGCLSCKKLKIKCTEDKPTCEYCLHTNRECVYLNKPSFVKLKVVKTKQPPTSLNHDTILKLNSTTNHLQISNFELKLMKFYLEFGADFFSFKVNLDNYKFWNEKIPNLWCCSDLIKLSIYSLSSARLLASYNESNAFTSVYLECGDDEDQDNKTINLYDQVQHFKNKTIEMMAYSNFMIDSQIDSQEMIDIGGQLLVAKFIMTAVFAMLPDEDNDMNIVELNKFKIFKIFETTKDYQKILSNNFNLLQNSKYMKILPPTFAYVIDNSNDGFKFTQHLRSYILEKTNPLDMLQVSYLNFISSIESNCLKAIELNFPFALFFPISEISLDDDLILSLKQGGNHLALKLLFYICCIISIFDFKLARTGGVWNQVIEFYRKQCFHKFNNEFEDEFDQNVYDLVLARRVYKIPYDFNLIYNLGEPVQDFINGKIKLSPNEGPCVFF